MVGPRNQPASSLNEGQARYILIDLALREARWTLEDRTQVGLEIPVDGDDATPWNGVTDYCLNAPDGEVIGVVEAKRCSRNPREADEQLRHYVTEIAKRQSYAPFGFMTNGLQTWFWESSPYCAAHLWRTSEFRSTTLSHLFAQSPSLCQMMQRSLMRRKKS